MATVGRWLVRLGINRRADIDPDGSTNRKPGRISARYPGHMVHLDVKKVGRIPDGGGWRVHGRGSAADRAAQRAKTKGARGGYVYLHSALDYRPPAEVETEYYRQINSAERPLVGEPAL